MIDPSSAISGLPWPTFSVDVDGRSAFNAWWCTLLGVTAADHEGRDWLDDIVDDDRAVVAERWARARVDGRPWEATTRLRAVDRIVPVVLRVVPTPGGWYGGVTDLSGERAAVDDAEDRLRAAEDTAGVGTWMVDFVNE
ncbi:MAG TPA: PAS domain-containing protein, partial [Myxococcota bacterium]